MISSAICDKPVQANFPPAHRQVALENSMNSDLFQTVWGKSHDNFLIIYMQKYEVFLISCFYIVPWLTSWAPFLCLFAIVVELFPH